MLDPYDLINAVLQGSIEGVNGALEDIAGIARRRAPVRKLFKGGRKRSITGAIGVHNNAYDATKGLPFNYKYHLGNIVGYAPKTRSLVAQSTTPRQGRVNSQYPVSRKINGVRLAGGSEVSFREVRGGQFVHQLVLSRIGGKSNRLDVLSAYLGRAIRDVEAGRGVRVVPGGDLEYGGALRDSIAVQPARRFALEVWGSVSAHATDPGRDFDYAWAQEMGTAHNRAQPFLRPALREGVQAGLVVRHFSSKIADETQRYFRAAPRIAHRGVSGRGEKAMRLAVIYRGIDSSVQRVNAGLRRAGMS